MTILYTVVALLFTAENVCAVNWTDSTGGNWTDNANWATCNPNGVDAYANFSAAICCNITVTLNANRTVGHLRFNYFQGTYFMNTRLACIVAQTFAFVIQLHVNYTCCIRAHSWSNYIQ